MLYTIAENGIVRTLFKSLYCHSEQSEGISKCLNQLEQCYIIINLFLLILNHRRYEIT
jgi:hypothetical protein